MLSYMVPSTIEEKPPLEIHVPNKKALHLVLDGHLHSDKLLEQNTKVIVSDYIDSATTATTSLNKRKININSATISPGASSNSSSNSLLIISEFPTIHSSNLSNATTSGNTEKSKLNSNNAAGKQTSLKRVSFGSSKGSMVETLIYEISVREEPEKVHLPSSKLILSADDETDSNTSEGLKVTSSKVKVSFFDSADRKYVIGCADQSTNFLSDDFAVKENFVMSSPVQTNFTSLQYSYQRQESTDSGWENPFRPDGDLSKEADEIVELIKEGKPITPTQTGNLPKILEENSANRNLIQQNFSSNKFNGNVDNKTVTGVEIQRGTVATPTEGAQVEHVLIKKKAKCKCCVIS